LPFFKALILLALEKGEIFGCGGWVRQFFFNNQIVSADRIYVTAGQAAQKVKGKCRTEFMNVTAGQAAQKIASSG